MMFNFKRIDFNTSFKKIIANTGYLFGERIFNLLLSLIVGVYVARYLGPHNYGLLSYAQSLSTLFMAIAGLGLTNIVIRNLVKSSELEEGKILGTTFVLMIGAGVIGTFFLILTGFLLNKNFLTRILIIIVSTNLILQVFRIFDYWFQSKVLSKYSSYARSSGQVVASILKVIFIVLSLSVLYFALTIMITGVVSGLLWIYFYHKNGNKLSNWSFDLQYAKGLLKDAWPLILSAVSVSVYMNIDQVMLKSMVNANAVGNYAVAVKISVLWYFIPMAIASSVFPAIINAKKESEKKYYRRLQYLYDFMAGLAIMIAIPMTFLSNTIISFLFGKEYISAGSALSVLIWSGVFVFLGVARNKWIINENYQRYGMLFTVTGAIVNVILNIWLIPIIGIMGAAWATLISQMLSSWIMALLFKKTRISFIMLGKSLVKVITIIPFINSIRWVIEEARY